MSRSAHTINMEVGFQDYSDKEDAAPDYDVHYPPLPLNAKGNIVMKNPFNAAPARDRPSISSNTSRKRRGLDIFTETPPRPSRSSQISKIFAGEASSRSSVASRSLHSPTSIPDEAMRVYEHFSQAMRTTPKKSPKQETPKGTRRRKGNAKRSPQSRRRPDSKRNVPPPSPASSAVDSDESSLQRVDSGCDLRRLDCEELAKNWPTITSGRQTVSPPRAIPRSAPESVPSLTPQKPQTVSVGKNSQDVAYPDLSAIVRKSLQYGQVRLLQNDPIHKENLPPHVSALPNHHHSQTKRSSASHQSGMHNGSSRENISNAHLAHDIDRLQLINRKLAGANTSPQHRDQPISFLAEDEEPANDFKMAVAKSFSSTTPDRDERRKTLNIKVTHASPPNRAATMPVPPAHPVYHARESEVIPGHDDNDSTDSWTGDEIFFPKPILKAQPQLQPQPQQAPQRSMRSQLMRAQTESTIWQNRWPPPPPMGYPMMATPMRTMRSSRFPMSSMLGRRGLLPGPYSVPNGSGVASGVPLSMEEHPSSAGSDADGEDNSDTEN